jgi:hypothetical protein
MKGRLDKEVKIVIEHCAGAVLATIVLVTIHFLLL